MEGLSDAVRAKIAADVIDGLTKADKEKLLKDALKEMLGDYKLKSAIEAGVMDFAKREMSSYLDKEEVRERIRQETVAAVGRFIGLIPQALIDVLLRSCMGYSQYGGKESTDFSRAIERLLGIKRT